MKFEAHMFIKNPGSYWGCARITKVGDETLYEATGEFCGDNTCGYEQRYNRFEKDFARPNCSKHPTYKAYKKPTTKCIDCIKAWGYLNGSIRVSKEFPEIFGTEK